MRAPRAEGDGVESNDASVMLTTFGVLAIAIAYLRSRAHSLDHVVPNPSSKVAFRSTKGDNENAAPVNAKSGSDFDPLLLALVLRNTKWCRSRYQCRLMKFCI